MNFLIFAFICISYLPNLFKNEWNGDKDKTYMKMERNVVIRGVLRTQ